MDATSLRTKRMMWIFWPAFIVAGILEMLVFAVVDPQDIHGLNGQEFNLSPQAIYTGAFFIFWSLTSLVSGLTYFLSRPPDEIY